MSLRFVIALMRVQEAQVADTITELVAHQVNVHGVYCGLHCLIFLHPLIIDATTSLISRCAAATNEF
jgi:hypothetical protein